VECAARAMQNNCGRVKLNGTVGLQAGSGKIALALSLRAPLALLSRSACFYVVYYMPGACHFIAILRFFAPQRSRALSYKKNAFQITRSGNNYGCKIILYALKGCFWMDMLFSRF
jgi:hypothetical protein